MFLTKGVGKHKEKLASFELALRDAGIQKYNLVEVSSILPPGCEIIDREEGVEELDPGQIVFCVMSQCQSNEPGRRIASSVGVAIPQNPSFYGYLSEHHDFGRAKDLVGDYAEDLAAEMLASTLGIEFDVDSNYDQKREIFRIDGRIIHTRNVTAAAVSDEEGRWTTVLSAAVFLP